MTDEPLTYDELFDTVVKEKSQEEIQKITPNFLDRVKIYISSKQAAVRTSATDNFALQRKEKAMQQLKNIRRVLQDLYDRRERKIMDLARVKVRTGTLAMDLSVLSPEEEALFNVLTDVLGKSREEHNKALEMSVPVVDKLKRVVFLEDISTFMGADMQTYGPFKGQETAELPSSLADVLIENKKAKQA